MGDVMIFKKPAETWASGPMRCLRCKHETVTVRKLPEAAITDCPSCGCHTFVAAGIYSAGKDEAVWVCNCGNTLMELVVDTKGKECLFCIGCGHEKPVSS